MYWCRFQIMGGCWPFSEQVRQTSTKNWLWVATTTVKYHTGAHGRAHGLLWQFRKWSLNFLILSSVDGFKYPWFHKHNLFPTDQGSTHIESYLNIQRTGWAQLLLFPAVIHCAWMHNSRILPTFCICLGTKYLVEIHLLAFW